MGSTSFLGFSSPNLNLLVIFLNLLFLGTCCIFFRKCWDFRWVFNYLFSVPYFGLACDYGNSLLCLEELRKMRYWIEVRTVFDPFGTIDLTTAIFSPS